jgi:hypothetical protein
MWEMYLELFPENLAPVDVWNLQVLDSPVIEINSAASWVTFLEIYGRDVNGLTHSDWSDVCNDYAGVHLTARAVAAIQGFSFRTSRGLTAPSFWDVEQTVWLRWVFSSVSPVT